jgi:hypothetical protein
VGGGNDSTIPGFGHSGMSPYRRAIVALLATTTIVLLIVQLANVPRAAAASSIQSATSRKWAGFALKNGHSANITSVMADWVVPAVTCGATESSASAVWAGVGGVDLSLYQEGLLKLGNPKPQQEPLYQVGTDSDCEGGTPTYYAWKAVYEPAAPDALKKIGASKYPVVPGDSLQVFIRDQGRFTTYNMTDTRNGTQLWEYSSDWTNTKAGFHSAECIVEDPAQRNKSGYANFADYGTVTFADDCQAGFSNGSNDSNGSKLYAWGEASSKLPKNWTSYEYTAKSGKAVLARVELKKNFDVVWESGNGQTTASGAPASSSGGLQPAYSSTYVDPTGDTIHLSMEMGSPETLAQSGLGTPAPCGLNPQPDLALYEPMQATIELTSSLSVQGAGMAISQSGVIYQSDSPYLLHTCNGAYGDLGIAFGFNLQPNQPIVINLWAVMPNAITANNPTPTANYIADTFPVDIAEVDAGGTISTATIFPGPRVFECGASGGPNPLLSPTGPTFSVTLATPSPDQIPDPQNPSNGPTCKPFTTPTADVALENAY